MPKKFWTNTLFLRAQNFWHYFRNLEQQMPVRFYRFQINRLLKVQSTRNLGTCIVTSVVFRTRLRTIKMNSKFRKTQAELWRCKNFDGHNYFRRIINLSAQIFSQTNCMSRCRLKFKNPCQFELKYIDCSYFDPVQPKLKNC